MNGQHLRALPHNELWERLQPFLKQDGQNFDNKDALWVDKTLGLLKTSFETLLEAIPVFRSLSDSHFEINSEAAEVMAWPSTNLVISTWKILLESLKSEFLAESEFLDLQKQLQELCKVKGKELFQALRVAIIGKPHGAELKFFVPLMSRESLILRATKVLEAKN